MSVRVCVWWRECAFWCFNFRSRIWSACGDYVFVDIRANMLAGAWACGNVRASVGVCVYKCGSICVCSYVCVCRVCVYVSGDVLWKSGEQQNTQQAFANM